MNTYNTKQRTLYLYSNKLRFIAIKKKLDFLEKSQEAMFNLYFSHNEFWVFG